jgi:hypothetical protein
MLRFLVISSIGVLMAACQSTSSSAPEPEIYNYTPVYFAGLKATPAERLKCESIGGKFRQNVGIRGIDICYQELPDAGKICRDSDECLSECIAADRAEIGASTTGECSISETNYGCMSRVEDGRVEPILCVD